MGIIRTIGLVVVAATMLMWVACRVTYKSSDLFNRKESEAIFKNAQDLQFRGQLDSALILFNKADSAEPNSAMILHARGLLKSNMKLYEDAIIDLDKSIELTTDDKMRAVRVGNEGLTYMQMGKLDRACVLWESIGNEGKVYLKSYCK